MREVERRIQIMVIDEKWRDHLYEIDQLRGGIGLRAYGQKDPLLEYKAEAYRMFEELMSSVEEDTIRYLFRVMPAPVPGAGAQPMHRPALAGGGVAPKTSARIQEQHSGVSAYQGGSAPAAEEAGGGSTATMTAGRPPRSAGPPPAGSRTVVRSQPKIGRNEPCPCGSGKKYKKCCGQNA